MLTDEGLTNAELVHNALLANFAYADDDPSVIELRDAVLDALTAANRLIPEGAEVHEEWMLAVPGEPASGAIRKTRAQIEDDHQYIATRWGKREIVHRTVIETREVQGDE